MSMPPPPPGQNPPPFQPGQQPPPGYQQFGQPAATGSAKTNGLAVASMVLGIIGIPLFCLYAIPSILAVIFGAVSLSQFKKSPGAFTGRGMAVAGLVCGLVGIAILVLVLAVGKTRYTVN